MNVVVDTEELSVRNISHSRRSEWSVPMAATVHPLTYIGLLFQVGLGSSSSMVPMASSLKGKLRGEEITGVVSRA